MKTIQLEIEDIDPFEVHLINKNGDIFHFNPLKHEGLNDFLLGAKIIKI